MIDFTKTRAFLMRCHCYSGCARGLRFGLSGFRAFFARFATLLLDSSPVNCINIGALIYYFFFWGGVLATVI